jgi:hypothetical protein
MSQQQPARWEYRRLAATAQNEMQVLREMGQDG